MSYVCASTGTCEAVPASPGSPLFSNLAACAATCHVPDISFGCSPQLGCHVVHVAPNAAIGLYSNMESCAATCSTPKPPRPEENLKCTVNCVME